MAKLRCESWQYIINVNLFLPFNLVNVFHFDLRMAARSYEAGFRKYYGDRLTNISDDTSDEEIRQVNTTTGLEIMTR